MTLLVKLSLDCVIDVMECEFREIVLEYMCLSRWTLYAFDEKFLVSMCCMIESVYESEVFPSYLEMTLPYVWDSRKGPSLIVR